MNWPNLHHLRMSGLTWFEHNVRAMTWAIQLYTAAIALTIHAFFPWMLENTASNKISKLYKEINIDIQKDED